MPQSKRRKPKHTGPTRSRKPEQVQRKPSPLWFTTLMFTLMGLGVLLVLLRYVLSWDNTVLFIGLGALAAGFLMTTAYR